MTTTTFDRLDDDWRAAFVAAFEAAHEARPLADLRDERLRTAAALERLAHVCGAPSWSSQLASSDSAGRGGSRTVEPT